MKMRLGFVSNSSSSSFLIYKKGLSDYQLHMIRNHYHEGYKLQTQNGLQNKYVIEKYYKQGLSYDSWDLIEEEDVIKVQTIMDNFDMASFLQDIGLTRDGDVFRVL